MSRILPPSRRIVDRYQERLGGRRSIFVDVGRYPDGSPCEVFVSAARQGSETIDLYSAFGIVTSLALQHGIAAGKIADALRGFEEGTFPDVLARCLNASPDEPYFDPDGVPASHARAAAPNAERDAPTVGVDLPRQGEGGDRG